MFGLNVDAFRLSMFTSVIFSFPVIVCYTTSVMIDLSAPTIRQNTDRRKPGPKPIDLTNSRFGRLTALTYAGESRWICLCDCGNSTTVRTPELKRGRTQSCGCIHREIVKSGVCRRTHGMASTPEYRSWTSMIRRCTDPTAFGYHRYGGRGITVCERWLHSFPAFFEDMGSRPAGTSIDRLENDGNYELGNCRWATRAEQNANTSTAILVTVNGKTQPVGAWARELGVSSRAIFYRIRIWGNTEKVITTPFRPHKPH